jgi:hypothetical protein
MSNCTFNNSYIGGHNAITVQSCVFNHSYLILGTTECCFGPVILEDSSFSGSSFVSIGLASNVRIERCSFSDNIATEGSFRDRLLTVSATDEIEITSCLFSDNQFGNGSALELLDPFGNNVLTTIENCTIRNNSSSGLSAGIVSHTFVTSCENVDFVDNVALNGSPDAFVPAGCELNLNCCDIDEANIGGEGQVTISFDGCTVSSETTSWGGLKALFR